MEFLSVVMLSFVGCFIALIITLVFFNFIILMSDEDKPKAKALNKQRKSFGLSKERVERISLKTEQAYLDKYPQQGTKQITFVENISKDGTNHKVITTSKETPPDHKTRVALRKKRKSKQ